MGIRAPLTRLGKDNSVTILPALWRGLLPILKSIGRWIIERLVTKGRAWLLAVMEDRIDAFKRRWYRAKTVRRKRWLGGRIDRWVKARRWLGRQLVSRHDVAQCRREAVGLGIPMQAAGEREPKAA